MTTFAVSYLWIQPRHEPCQQNTSMTGWDHYTSAPSHRLHRNAHNIVHQANFFLHEWLRVADSAQQPIVPSLGKGALADLFFRNKKPAPGRLIPILRRVRHQRLMPLLDIRRDIDDEARTH